MGNIAICDPKLCTSCGACENVCPKGCVERILLDSNFQMLKGDSCIDCGLCDKVCPATNNVILNDPTRAYAAWANDINIRNKSSSGGIASTLYQYALQHGMYIVGASMAPDFSCKLMMSTSFNDIQRFQGSKYTYSYPDSIYKEVATCLKNGEKVLFIGLPCQVGALSKYLQTLRIQENNVLKVDLICHGTPNPQYLKDHIQHLENQKYFTAQSCFFRDGNYRTQDYVFSLYDKDNRLVYKKKVNDTDLYQIGYHGGAIYKDSCYRCKYAQVKRTGDITIADYHVKHVDECDIDTENVSLILSNTDKGEKLINDMLSEQLITAIERPLDEPITGEKQLRHPTIVPTIRNEFMKYYHEYSDFEMAASKAFKKEYWKRKYKINSIKMAVKMGIKTLIPHKLWRELRIKFNKE